MAIYDISKKRIIQYNFHLKEKTHREFPDGPVVRIQNFHCQGSMVQSVVGGIKRSQIAQCGGGRQGSTAIVDNNCKTILESIFC